MLSGTSEAPSGLARGSDRGAPGGRGPFEPAKGGPAPGSGVGEELLPSRARRSSSRAIPSRIGLLRRPALRHDVRAGAPPGGAARTKERPPRMPGCTPRVRNLGGARARRGGGPPARVRAGSHDRGLDCARSALRERRRGRGGGRNEPEARRSTARPDCDRLPGRKARCPRRKLATSGWEAGGDADRVTDRATARLRSPRAGAVPR
jgi:hypothetical protein